jgi:hypothetical protein
MTDRVSINRLGSDDQLANYRRQDETLLDTILGTRPWAEFSVKQGNDAENTLNIKVHKTAYSTDEISR